MNNGDYFERMSPLGFRGSSDLSLRSPMHGTIKSQLRTPHAPSRGRRGPLTDVSVCKQEEPPSADEVIWGRGVDRPRSALPHGSSAV